MLDSVWVFKVVFSISYPLFSLSLSTGNVNLFEKKWKKEEE
jgi:hypothetical protein